MNLVTALGFYSMFGSLESLLNLEQKHEMVTAISVEVFLGVLQTEQEIYRKMEGSNRDRNEHQTQRNLLYTIRSTIFGGFNVGSNVQEQVSCTFRSCGREEYKTRLGIKPSQCRSV